MLVALILIFPLVTVYAHFNTDSRRAFDAIDFFAAVKQNKSLTYVDYSHTHTTSALPAVRRQFAAQTYDPPSHQTQVKDIISTLSVPRIKTQLDDLTQFNNRFCWGTQGLNASRWLTQTLNDIAATRPDLNINVTATSHALDWDPFWLQETVTVQIPSRTPDAPVTILGAHIDTWNDDGASVFDQEFLPAQGVDDDGSGATNLIVTFRSLLAAEDAKWTPQTPLEFHFYSCEELGLLGSELVSRDYLARGIPVKAQFQLDMTLYTKPGNIPTMGLITDSTDPILTDYIALLIEEYVDMPYEKVSLPGGTSDNASWTDKGYPASFVFETNIIADSNPNIHSAGDVFAVEGNNVAQSLEFNKLAIAFAYELTA